MKKTICFILIAVFVAILVTSTFFIVRHYREADKRIIRNSGTLIFCPRRSIGNIAYFLYCKLTTVCFLSGQFTIDFLYANRT